MTTPRTCPRCGAPLAESGSASGLCPRCLIALGIEDDESFVATRSGGAPPPSPEELAGAFPELEIEELLGQGGMGAVYRARQKKLDRLVALKVLRSDLAQDPAFAERFQREARVLGRLSHPGIVAVHDAGCAGDFLYLLMEYVDGANLRSVLRSGELASKEVLALVGQLCEALQYAHDEGIVHRDIKPENILVDTRGRVKIADFGLVKLLRGERGQVTLTEPAQAVGTAHYMAPEQVEHPRDVDHRADIYALGVVFYEMLTGELPIGRFAPPSEKVRVDVRLDEVVLKTLAKEPQRRYQAADDVKTDVERIAERAEKSKLKFVREGKGWKVGIGVLDPTDLDWSNLDLEIETGLSACMDLAGCGEEKDERKSKRKRKREREREASGGERHHHGCGGRDGDGRREHRSHRWKWLVPGLLTLAFFPCCFGGAFLMLSGRRATVAEAEATEAARVAAELAHAATVTERAGRGDPAEVRVPSLAGLLETEGGLDAATVARADAVLARSHARYLALEDEHIREFRTTEDPSVRVVLDAFLSERMELEATTLVELAQVFGDERWSELESVVDLIDVFPFGRVDTTLLVERVGPGWVVEVRADGATAVHRMGTLEEPYRRIWERFQGKLR